MPEPLTRAWQKWRFSTPQKHLWLIKHWFTASTFVVKIATFAKPETFSRNFITGRITIIKQLKNRQTPVVVFIQ